MERPWFTGGAIAKSGTVDSPGSINLVRARTLTVTASVKYHGSATGSVTCYLYYSPDGENFDTVAYTSFAITVTAGATVQRTAIVDVPEHGYMRVGLTNADATYATSEHKVWYTIQAWPPYHRWEEEAAGEITTETE